MYGWLLDLSKYDGTIPSPRSGHVLPRFCPYFRRAARLNAPKKKKKDSECLGPSLKNFTKFQMAIYRVLDGLRSS